MYNLEEMYRAWQQGNENYIQDWVHFVEMAAREARVTNAEMMRELQRYHWFEWGHVR